MNAIRGMLRLSLRGYRTNRGSTSARRPKAPRMIEMTQPGMPVEDFFAEAEDPDDVDAYESDFKNVAEYDKMHERELEIAKDRLKTQIVKRKYFKTEEPSMLTWGEKEQIRLLHAQDPEEWTPEKLSESFPVSRDGALKILRSKWSPRSAEVVRRYEETVKENWTLFRAGKLKMDPQLEAHLEKFRDRRVEPTDPKTVAKLLKPKPAFPKPRSSMFANIIQSYLDANPASRDDEDDEIREGKATKSGSFERVMREDSQSQRSEESAVARQPRKLATEERISSNKTVTFDEFLRNHVESRAREDGILTPVDRVLVEELKARGTEDYKKKSLVLESASAVSAWNEEDGRTERRREGLEKKEIASSSEKEEIALISEREEIALISEREEIAEARLVPDARKKQLDVTRIAADTSVDPKRASVLESSAETGIIAREKTEAALQDDYPDTIEIPRKKYKRGVTYRVQDRYYDDDGELLYRVPGLKA